MAAMARILVRAFSIGDDQLTTIAIFCGLGLLASLLFVSFYAADLATAPF